MNKLLQLIEILHIGSDGDAQVSFVWEETKVSGENPHGQTGDDLTFLHTTPAIESGMHW